MKRHIKKIPIMIDVENLAWMDTQDKSIAKIVNTLLTKERTQSGVINKDNKNEQTKD